MTRLDPVIAVKDIVASSTWYKQIFGLKTNQDSDHFAVLLSDDNEVMICLHNWLQDNHPTMMNPDIEVGNGLLLYFRTDQMNRIYENAIKAGCEIEEEIHLNGNSGKREFSLRDPDGYYLTVSEFHQYEG